MPTSTTCAPLAESHENVAPLLIYACQLVILGLVG